MHTFGVGDGASEQLIKNVAFKGFGHYYFIYDESELDEKVVSALSKTRLNYKVLQKVTLFDAGGQEINTRLKGEAEPLLEDTFVDLSVLLPPDVAATRYSVEILDPNTMLAERFEGQVLQVQSQSLINYAVQQLCIDIDERKKSEIEHEAIQGGLTRERVNQIQE